MALSGTITGTTANTGIKSVIIWEAVQSVTDNTSIVTARLYYAKGNSNQNTYGTWSGSITIDGHTEKFSNIRLTLTPNSGNVLAATFTKEITHEENGLKTITISATGAIGGTSLSYTSVSGTVQLDTIPRYHLVVIDGAGVHTTVYRVASEFGSIGLLSFYDLLYYGDELKISYEVESYYKLESYTVNSRSFSSGNTKTVTGPIRIISDAKILSSTVGANDAAIESNSTIVVNKVDNNHVHSLQFHFGELTGYIANDGSVVSDEVKYGDTTVSFHVPADFYSQIPDSSVGECKIVCRTYESTDSETIFGVATECSFMATAIYERCAPFLDVSVIDDNQETSSLTGDAKSLIRYMSTAKCTATARGTNYATISSIIINNMSIPHELVNGASVGVRMFPEVTATMFTVIAVDSRGHKTEMVVPPKAVYDYSPLTCNPVLSRRPSETGGAILMTATGNIYGGSFNGRHNTLAIKYRYREHGGSYGDWNEIDMTKVTIGTSSYRVDDAISLGEEFDHQKPYEFQIEASDGTPEHHLSVITITVNVKKGIPVFDWGENDFNVNGILNINNVNVFDIIYPIGTIFMYSENSMPEAISNIGSWETYDTGIAGVYAWKRIEKQTE